MSNKGPPDPIPSPPSAPSRFEETVQRLDPLPTGALASGEAFDPPLDPKIRHIVSILRYKGIETYESCQGGHGHAYYEPTVRFHGDLSEGLRALSVAIKAGLHVSQLSRIWNIIDNEPHGPHWQLTFNID